MELDPSSGNFSAPLHIFSDEAVVFATSIHSNGFFQGLFSLIVGRHPLSSCMTQAGGNLDLVSFDLVNMQQSRVATTEMLFMGFQYPVGCDGVPYSGWLLLQHLVTRNKRPNWTSVVFVRVLEGMKVFARPPPLESHPVNHPLWM